jgi:hypothetical protein
MSKKKWREIGDLPALQKGRRPRRRLTAEGRNALGRLRIMIVTGAVILTGYLTWFSHQKMRTPTAPTLPEKEEAR